jgi:hypothetical protein
VRLQINHAETLSDHRDWEGEIRVVKCLSNFQTGINFLSSAFSLRSLREDCTFGKHREIEVDSSGTA